MCETVDEVGSIAKNMCGKHLVHPTRTGTDGYLCESVLIFEKITSAMNIYIAIEYSRSHGGPVIHYSQHGGLSLDLIRNDHPQDLYTIKPDLRKGLQLTTLLEIGENLGIYEHQHKLLFVVRNMWELFIVRDCTFL